MIRAGARRAVATLFVVLLVGCRAGGGSDSWLSDPQTIAPGINLYRSSDNSLVEDAGPVAVFLLRLDPGRVRLSSVLSNDKVADAETVMDIAARHHALAAVNGGFFNGANGEPTGVLKVSGELVSDASVSKGAVVISAAPGQPTTLTFDRLAAKMSLVFATDTREWTVPIDGVDTTRERGKLMLYTPAYHDDTDTAPTGTEWVLQGNPLRVTAIHPRAGHTAIPPDGVVLSYGGLILPDALRELSVDATVALQTSWRTGRGLPSTQLDAAEHIVNGAGLLRWQGQVVSDWTAEGLTPEVFTNVFHPRTMIGVDAEGFIWLAAIDGRQPEHSIGMRFRDLQRLADRLKLSDALNLDGGGSTTMVVQGAIVNRPSDPAGPRPVGDAILVMPR
jgi:hypothetical protein